MLDVPDGAGKAPIGPNYVAENRASGRDAEPDEETCRVQGIDGRWHRYPPHC